MPSPYINRFLSADTIVPGYANPQALNRYSYVLGNPLRYTDPTGHLICLDGVQCYDGGSTLPILTGGPTPPNNNNDDGDEEEIIIGPTPPPACASGGMYNCPPPPPTVIYPSTVTLHPFDGNVVSQVPIYDYSYHPPKLIGYRVTSYAYGQFHFSLLDYFVPSGPITGAAFVKDYILDPLLKPGIQNLTTLGIDLSCPVCAVVLSTVSTVDSLNNAISFDAHLRIHDIYISTPPISISTPLDIAPIVRIP